MAGLKLIPVRATVTVGHLTASTPYVVSFNVNRSRGQVSTFNATLKVPYSSVSNAVGGDVTISAGPVNNVQLIFTGICRSSNVTPCRDDPAYVMLTVSGEDILSELKGKKITRRCKSSKATWVGITGVVREGLKDSKLMYQKGDENFYIDGMKENENKTLVKTHTQSEPKQSDVSKPPTKVEDKKINPDVKFVTQ